MKIRLLMLSRFIFIIIFESLILVFSVFGLDKVVDVFNYKLEDMVCIWDRIS